MVPLRLVTAANPTLCVCECTLTCAGSRGLGKMALTGLSRGDRQEFSLECLCFSAIWGEPGNRMV